MANRQAQRDAQKARRREERARVRREVRQTRVAEPSRPSGVAPEPGAKKPLPWAWMVAGSIAAVLVLVGGFFLVRTTFAPLPGKVYASQGNLHINPGDAHPVYNSNPPTSGWHFPTWPNRGIYTDALPEEYLLHFQEHAGVVVHYNPNTLPESELSRLRQIVNQELSIGQGLIVLAPDPNIPNPIDLTAWQHMESFDRVTGNESKIKDFIERLQCNYDPEGVCGPPHGKSTYPTGTPEPGVATVVSGQIPGNTQSGNVMPGQKAETPLAGTEAPSNAATPAAGSTATPAR